MPKYVIGIVRYGQIEIEAKDGIEAMRKAGFAENCSTAWNGTLIPIYNAEHYVRRCDT